MKTAQQYRDEILKAPPPPIHGFSLAGEGNSTTADFAREAYIESLVQTKIMEEMLFLLEKIYKKTMGD